MTKEAMMAVFGGGHGIGNYYHVHNGRTAKYGRYFDFKRFVGGKLRKYRQYQWTWKRLQTVHKGKLVRIG